MREFLFKEDIKNYLSFSEATRQLVKDFEVNHPKDIYRFYINMERLYQIYAHTDPVIVPTQDGGYFTFSYCEKGCLLSQTNKAGEQIDLITEDTLAIKEKQVLKTIMAQTGFSTRIGHRYPDKLTEFLRNEIEHGDVITFSDGQSYLCTEKQNVYITLQQTCPASVLKHVGISDFLMDHHPFTINPYDSDQMQSFYNYIKDKSTGNVIPILLRNATVSTGRILTQIKTDMEQRKEDSQVLIFGRETFFVRKKGSDYYWYNKNRVQIPERIIRNYLGWLKTTPLKVKVRDQREVSTFIKDATAAKLYEKIQENLMSGLTDAIYKNIYNFCLEYKDAVSVKVASYVDENNQTYKAREFLFQYQNGTVNVYEAIREMDNFSFEPSKIVPSSKTAFIDFCEKKMLRQKEVIREEVLSNILNRSKGNLMLDTDEIYQMTEVLLQNERGRYAPFSLSDVSEAEKEIQQMLDLFEGGKVDG